MTITYDSFNSVYLWKNKANQIYKLHPTKNHDELRVDESVGYYKSANWTIAKVTEEGIYSV